MLTKSCYESLRADVQTAQHGRDRAGEVGGLLRVHRCEHKVPGYEVTEELLSWEEETCQAFNTFYKLCLLTYVCVGPLLPPSGSLGLNSDCQALTSTLSHVT